MKWTSGDIVDALRQSFGITGDPYLSNEEWSLFTEVPLRHPKAKPDGTLHKGYWGLNERTIDVFLVRNWTSEHGHERLAIEVKISRSDYRNETDEKRAPAEHAAHRTVYAAPAGLIDPAALHPGWGLIEVHETDQDARKAKGAQVGGGGRCTWRVKATRRTPDCDLDYLVAAIARKGARATERLRRGADQVALVPSLQADVERLTTMLQRRDEALARETARAKAARAELLALDGIQECADCAGPLTFARGGRGDGTWTHRDRDAEQRCYQVRAEANRRAREAATGARYLTGWADPVEPKILRAARLAQEAADAAEDAARDVIAGAAEPA